MLHPQGARLLTRASVVAGTVLIAGGLAGAAPADAATQNFGQAVYSCARMMLPYYIDARGGITMPMPDGTTMEWRNFGAMVTYMQKQEMCG